MFAARDATTIPVLDRWSKRFVYELNTVLDDVLAVCSQTLSYTEGSARGLPLPIF